MHSFQGPYNSMDWAQNSRKVQKLILSVQAEFGTNFEAAAARILRFRTTVNEFVFRDENDKYCYLNFCILH